MRVTLRLAGIGLASLLFVSCACERDPKDAAPAPVPGQAAQAPPAAPASQADATGGAVVDDGARMTEARAAAFRDAADVVQRYLARLGGADLPAAEALWARNRAPRGNEEAGLRALTPLRALRSQTRTPRVLDAEAVPGYVEVPVEIRATTRSGEAVRYAGWYRLRRDPIGGRWEIIATSIQPQLR